MSHSRVLFSHPDFSLDTLDRLVTYLSEREQKPYREVMEQSLNGKEIAPERLWELIKKAGAETWVVRFVLRTWLSQEGIEEEWNETLACVRPTTAVLLRRLRKQPGVRTLDQALACSDATFAIHDAESLELEMLRPEIQHLLWLRHAKELMPRVKKASAQLDEMQMRMKRMHEIAFRLSDSLQSTVLDTLFLWEKEVYVDGEAIPIETMDAEIGFAAQEV